MQILQRRALWTSAGGEHVENYSWSDGQVPNTIVQVTFTLLARGE